MTHYIEDALTQYAEALVLEGKFAAGTTVEDFSILEESPEGIDVIVFFSCGTCAVLRLREITETLH